MDKKSLGTLIESSRIENVSNIMKQNSFTIVILVIILIVLFITFFNYSFKRRNISKTKPINYSEDYGFKFNRLQTCSEIEDEQYNYKLCDYYILSSYNSHLIGNQKYDYVSIDMIRKVIESGARYIELEICANSVDKNAKPVIASGRLKGEWINSLNTLDIAETFAIIDSIAFEVNYPLFINLKLRTKNTRVINKLAKLIKEHISGTRILNPKRYYKYPISIEKLCKLLGKIVFFAEGDWSSTKLTDYVVPKFQCMSIFHHSKLNGINSNGPTPKHKILQTLRDDRKLVKQFIKAYPSIESVIKRKNNIYLDVIESEKYVNPLENYNKLCLSVVIPHDEDDVFTLNYDDSDAIQCGCNFITMNFQLDDDYMKQHITMFKDSSFVLKDKALRYPVKKDNVVDIDKLFPDEGDDMIYSNTNIIKYYSDKIVRIKTYSPDSLGKYITCSNRNIGLKSKQIPSKNSSSNIQFTDINQGFMMVPSSIYSRKIKNGVMFRKINVEDNEKQSLFIKKKGNGMYLDYLSSLSNLSNDPVQKENALMDFIFIITKSKCVEEDTISIVSASSLYSDTVKYVGSYGNRLRMYNDTNNVDMRENTCFSVELLPVERYVKITHYATGQSLRENTKQLGLLSFGGGSSNISSSNNTLFMIEKWEDNDEMIILKAPSNKYISIDFDNDNSLQSNIPPSEKHLAAKLTLIKSNNGYVIKDYNNVHTLYTNKHNIPFMVENDKINYMLSKKNINSGGNLLKIKNYYKLV